MNRTIEGLFTADYLWQKKGIVPILKWTRGSPRRKTACS
jgi:fructose-bisphosphate aldolase class I